MNIAKWLRVAIFCVACVPCMTLSAGEGALYAAEAPAGSGFVRVFLAGDQPLDATSIGGKTIARLDPLQVSAYAYLTPGEHQIKAGDLSVRLSVLADHYYTVVVGSGGESQVIEDHPFSNARKALLAFYNLSSQAGLTLRTQDGRHKIIENLAPMSRGEREINAVSIGLAAFVGEQKRAEVSDVHLERGKVSCVFAVGQGEATRLIVAESRVDTSL